MAQRGDKQTPYIRTGSFATMNEATLVRPGDLGMRTNGVQVKHQVVQLDSGATAATPMGVVLATQTAYWKDRGAYLVTNDVRIAPGGISDPAGIFVGSVTASNYTGVQTRGKCNVKCDGSAIVAGDFVIGNTSTPLGDVTRMAKGTAFTNPPFGEALGVPASNVVSVYLNLPEVN